MFAFYFVSIYIYMSSLLPNPPSWLRTYAHYTDSLAFETRMLAEYGYGQPSPYAMLPKAGSEAEYLHMVEENMSVLSDYHDGDRRYEPWQQQTQHDQITQ